MEYRRFFSPRNIYYGAGALESLTTVSCQRALVTTDRAIRALGMVERVERILQANGAATRIFDQVEAEPSKETAWQAFYLAQEFGPDLFVGLGGGREHAVRQRTTPRRHITPGPATIADPHRSPSAHRR